MEAETDHAQVNFPPPLIYLTGLLFGGLISWFYHFQLMPNLLARAVGILLVVLGLGVILNAKAKMSKAETDIKPWKPTTAILSDGIYAVSRNPIYLSLAIIYLGIAFAVNSLWMFPPVIFVMITVNFYVIAREERYLESKFGKEYLDYKNEVRRWI